MKFLLIFLLSVKTLFAAESNNIALRNTHSSNHRKMEGDFKADSNNKKSLYISEVISNIENDEELSTALKEIVSHIHSDGYGQIYFAGKYMDSRKYTETTDSSWGDPMDSEDDARYKNLLCISSLCWNINPQDVRKDAELSLMISEIMLFFRSHGYEKSHPQKFHYTEGMVAYLFNDKEEAYKKLKQVADDKNSPDRISAIYRLAIFAYQEHDFSTAKKLLSNILSDAPEHAKLSFSLLQYQEKEVTLNHVKKEIEKIAQYNYIGKEINMPLLLQILSENPPGYIGDILTQEKYNKNEEVLLLLISLQYWEILFSKEELPNNWEKVVEDTAEQGNNYAENLLQRIESDQTTPKSIIKRLYHYILNFN